MTRGREPQRQVKTGHVPRQATFCGSQDSEQGAFPHPPDLVLPWKVSRGEKPGEQETEEGAASQCSWGPSRDLPCLHQVHQILTPRQTRLAELTCSDMSRARNLRCVMAGNLSLRLGSVVQRMKSEGRISVSMRHFSLTTLTHTL